MEHDHHFKRQRKTLDELRRDIAAAVIRQRSGRASGYRTALPCRHRALAHP